MASGGMHEAPGCRNSFRDVGIRGNAVAQSFPERTITLINPYAAGGPADLLARTVADGMSESLGRPVVVENRPGAGTAIGARAVAQAKPDGYTLFLGGSPSHVITPALMKDANYDGIKDFTPIATVANVPNVLVVPPGRPYKSVKELVAAAKDADGKMTFASIGVGSIPQFLGVLLQLRAGVNCRGALQGRCTGRPSICSAAGSIWRFSTRRPSCPRFRAANCALAVADGRAPKPLPDTPTMAEGWIPERRHEHLVWISAPAGTPREVVNKLHAAIAQTLEHAEAQGKNQISRRADFSQRVPRSMRPISRPTRSLCWS